MFFFYLFFRIGIEGWIVELNVQLFLPEEDTSFLFLFEMEGLMFVVVS